jgi:hypothetical protein
LRGKDRKHAVREKKFLPDVIAEPLYGTFRRFFEVEATVTNNTVYKSLASLLHFVAKNDVEGYLVVPDKNKDFAQECLGDLREIIRAYSRTTRGRYPKVRLSILTFGEVRDHESRVLVWRENGKMGRPPVCPFFPRV